MEIYPCTRLKIWDKNGKTTIFPLTTRRRRLFSRLRHVPYAKVYIKVEYGYDVDVFGKRVMFYNDGYYTERREAVKALQAFLWEKR